MRTQLPHLIRIIAGPVQMDAELNDSPTAQEVWDALPINASANTWGDEIYFAIPVDSPLQDGKAVVSLGNLGYWPPGRAFCIFFGLTPASRGAEIRPASPVNIIGRVRGDATAFKQVRAGAAVRLERAEAEAR